MTSNKGKGLAAVVAQPSQNDRLSADPKLDRTSQTRIGSQLRAMYDDLMQQPVPDRFAELLSQLEQSPDAKPNGEA